MYQRSTQCTFFSLHINYFESFNAQKFGIKGVGKGPVTTIKKIMKLTF